MLLYPPDVTTDNATSAERLFNILNVSTIRKVSPLIQHVHALRAGISQFDLVTVYISAARPVLEYACQVWHTNLPKYLSDSIELIQNSE